MARRWRNNYGVGSTLLLILGVALILTGFAANGFAQERSITYMLWATDPKDQQTILQMARDFEREHPGTRVEVLFSTGTRDQREKIITMAAAGAPPDVFVVSRPWQYELWANGFFLPLTEWVERDTELMFSDIINAEQITMEGEVIGIHHHGGGQQLAFNAELFDAAGIERPDSQYRAGRWDHDAYVTAARAITRDIDGDGQADIFGSPPLSGGHDFLSVLRTFGETLLDPETGQPRINSPGGIEAIRWVTDLTTVYGVTGGNMGAGTRAMTNQCPRCVFRDWGRPEVYPFEWNIAPYPKGEFGHKNVGGHNFFAISSKTPHPELAQEFIKFNLQPDRTRASLLAGEILTPVRASIFVDPIMQASYPGLNLDVFLKAASPFDYLIPETVKVPGLSESISIMSQQIGLVNAGEQDPERAAQRIEEEIINQVLPRYR